MTEPLVSRAVAPDEHPGSSAATAVTVGTINKVIKDVVEGAFLPIWIRGEVSDFKQHRNGHWYFTLRDRSSQIRCVVWSREQRRMPAPPDDGMQVTAFGQLSVFAARADLQFSVRELAAKGDGLWRKALAKTLARLERDGLLAPERKRGLPPFPKTVAVITSPDGAALHDIIHVCRRRCPQVEIVLVPARVQGDGAAGELRAAVERVSRWGGADVVIVGRGGGAREDLWCFNDEGLARALAACPIPTISAVGHEVDSTICDLVADHRAATPSAAAEAAVPVVVDIGARLRLQGVRLRRAAAGIVGRRAERLERAKRVLPAATVRRLQQGSARLQMLAARINDLSPIATMARGFGVAVGEDGRTLGGVSDFKTGERFRLHLRDGSVAARTESADASPEAPGVV